MASDNHSLESSQHLTCRNDLQSRSYQQIIDYFTATYPVETWKKEGFFTDHDLVDINCYWLQFEPARTSIHCLLAILYIAIFVVGCSANCTVLYILIRCPHLRTPPNLIVMNLAASDFLQLVKMPVFIYNSFLQGPAMGKLGCNIYGFLGGFGGVGSIMSLAAVAIDRYLVISRPLSINRKTTRRRAMFIIVFIWLYAATFSILPLLGIGKYVPEGYLTSCSFDYLSDDPTVRLFILIFFVAAWVVPFSVISFCYAAIVQSVCHSRKSLIIDQPSHAQPRSALQEDNQVQSGRKSKKIELTIAKIVVGLVTLWMVAWTPYALVALIGISGNGHLLTPLVTMIPALFAKSAACIDPFVYSLNHPKIKAELFNRFRRLFLTPARDSNPFSDFERPDRLSRDRNGDFKSNQSIRSFNQSDCPDGHVRIEYRESSVRERQDFAASTVEKVELHDIQISHPLTF